MKFQFDVKKSLQELEGEDWGEPEFDSSLVRNCHRLRRVPLVNFTTEDLRMMIGQQISLTFLVPMALEILMEDPLAEGHCYPGDLLEAIVNISESFWDSHPDKQDDLRQMIVQAKKKMSLLAEEDADQLRDIFKNTPGTLSNP